MIDAALAAIAVPLLARHSVTNVLRARAKEIEENRRGAAISKQQPALPLAPVTLFEIFVRQSVAIDAVVSDSLGGVADGDTGAHQSPREVDVFRCARGARTQTFVQSSKPLEDVS